MEKSNSTYLEINEDEKIVLKGITSLTISNHGATEVQVFGRTLPPMGDAGPAYFDLPPDNTYSDLDFTVKFQTGKGKVFIDYKALIEENC